MAWQWKFLADLKGTPGDVSLYGPGWAPQRNVTATADLNTFKTPGVHRITTPDTQTILNLPAGMTTAGILENLQTGTGSTVWWAQRITQHGNAPRMWWRSTRDLLGGWNDWEEVLTDGGKITELHVFLAVGQSNMSGRGAPSGGSRDPENPRIMQYGATRRTLENAAVPLDMHDTATGLSPATSFARTYLKTQPSNVGVLIVPAAHGATGFTTSSNTLTWTPGAASAPQYDLPALAVTQTNEAVAAAKAAGYTVSVEGILFHQGENNSSMSQTAYASNVDTLIGYLRSGLGNTKLPFVVGQMSPEGIEATTGRENIDAAHKATPDRVAYTGFAAATRGGHNSGDTTHLSRVGVEFLGRNYANALQAARINADLKPRMKAVEATLGTIPAQVAAAAPAAVAAYIADDPAVIQAAADMAANNAGLLAQWKPNTAYTAGQQVVSPVDGDVLTRAVDGTSGATFTMTNWTPSATASGLAGKLDASQKGEAGGVATLDASAKIPITQLPDISATYASLGTDAKILYSQLPDAAKTANGAKPIGQGAFGIWAHDYGVKLDYVSPTNKGTDNADALDALFIAAKAAAVFGAVGMQFGPGAGRTTREWDIYRSNSPRLDIFIRGQSSQTTFLLSDFYGTGKRLVKTHDPLGVTRSSPTSVFHIQFGTVDRNGPNPVLLDIYGHGESRIESVRFGPSNNMVMSIAALQNVRYRDIASFYGGKHFNYKDTSGITFTTTAGSTTLTASADIFDGGDAGRMLNLYGTTAAKYLISTVTDARNVVISGTTPAITATGVGGVFEPARMTTVAGSNQVSANASVFTADDIGRVIYILGARSGPWGEALLRATITEIVSGLTVKLDVTADISKTRTEFYTPVIEFYSPAALGTTNRDNNDFKIDLLHVENYKGMGVVAQDAIFGRITNSKIHGEHSPTATQASGGAMWLDDYSGVISGELDGQATGTHRIYYCNMNDTLTLAEFASRRAVNAKIWKVGLMTDPGGIVECTTFTSYSASATGDPYDLVDDPNTTPRFIFTGLVNMLGDSLEPRIYKGKNTYFTKAGEMVTKSPDGTRYKITVANGGAISATVATG